MSRQNNPIHSKKSKLPKCSTRLSLKCTLHTSWLCIVCTFWFPQSTHSFRGLIASRTHPEPLVHQLPNISISIDFQIILQIYVVIQIKLCKVMCIWEFLSNLAEIMLFVAYFLILLRSNNIQTVFFIPWKKFPYIFLCLVFPLTIQNSNVHFFPFITSWEPCIIMWLLELRF